MTAQIPDTKPGNYYVTVRDGKRYDFLAGPFKDGHAVRSSPHFRGGVNRPATVQSAALDLVDRCREITESLDVWAHFYAFGTARIDCEYDKQGKLNAYLGLSIEKGSAVQHDDCHASSPSTRDRFALRPHVVEAEQTER